ncbi:protein BYPASS1-LIKE-like [Phragmites australis]|uniref:protein BYPASS1-LIKE-like n=1 Tax=Phragmites australis TaxID=29695 RepID=UPI002D7775B9|nr:protein BYPASS1-LIKE-like [Phragmites australis]
MPATDFQGSSSSHSHPSPFSSFGRSLLSLRRDTPASAAASPVMPFGDEADLEAFQLHVAAHLAELRGGEGGEEFLSIAWIRRLLEAFLLCQEELRVVVAHARRRGALPAPAEKLVSELGERALKALDVCNAARDGLDQVRRWERLAGIAASVLLAPGEIHEGQLRRARKALSDLSVLLIDDAAAAAGGGGGVASFLASHRNRSFGRARASPSRAASLASSSSSSSHFRSLSWSVSRTWSAARQLQAIGAGLAVPRTHEASGLAAPVYSMGCLLHLAAWALVTAVPCPDRGSALQAHHLPTAPPRAAFPWAPPLLALQERLTEEGKRKDRRNSCGLLKEIHALEKCAQRLAEAIDAATVPLTGEREAEVREAAAELAAVCAAMKDGLEPLDRQVREVFHRIVRSRMEGLDSPMLNGD